MLDEMSDRGIPKDAAVYRALAHFDSTAYATASPAAAAPASAATASAVPSAVAAPAAAATPDDGDDTG